MKLQHTKPAATLMNRVNTNMDFATIRCRNVSGDSSSTSGGWRRSGILSLLLLVIVHQSPTLAQQEPRPKYGPGAIRLYDQHEYLRSHAAPDFWALIPYYAAQQDDHTCSIASAVMVINALRVRRALRADEPLATQRGLLEKLPGEWRARVTPKGPGVTLAQLAALTSEAAEAYAVPRPRLETVSVQNANAATRSKLHQALVENERSDRDLIMVNFLQSELTGDPEGKVGHIAPVACYDEQRSMVLLLDPDRRWYEPYWVTLDALLRAMATRDETSGLNRGYVWVR